MAIPVFGPPPRAPSNTRSPTVLGRGAAAYGRTREVAALVLWTLAMFLGLALASYPEPNWVGAVGEVFAGWLASLVGLVSWALPLELFLLGIPLVRGKESAATPGRIAGDLLMAVVAAALVQVGSPGRTAFGANPAGGLIDPPFAVGGTGGAAGQVANQGKLQLVLHEGQDRSRV